MAGNQHRRYLHTSDAACVLVVQEQRIAEVRLVDPLNRGRFALAAFGIGLVKQELCCGFERGISVRGQWCWVEMLFVRLQECVLEQIETFRHEGIGFSAYHCQTWESSLLPCSMPALPWALRLTS